MIDLRLTEAEVAELRTQLAAATGLLKEAADGHEEDPDGNIGRETCERIRAFLASQPAPTRSECEAAITEHARTDHERAARTECPECANGTYYDADGTPYPCRRCDPRLAPTRTECDEACPYGGRGPDCNPSTRTDHERAVLEAMRNVNTAIAEEHAESPGPVGAAFRAVLAWREAEK